MRNTRNRIAHATPSRLSRESLASWCRERTIGLIALALLAAACALSLPETPADCQAGSPESDALRDYLRLKIGDIRAEVSWGGRCS